MLTIAFEIAFHLVAHINHFLFFILLVFLFLIHFDHQIFIKTPTNKSLMMMTIKDKDESVEQELEKIKRNQYV